MKHITITIDDNGLEARIAKLEKQMSKETDNLAALKADVDAHNVADAKFQTGVNQKVADLEAAVAANDMTAVDAAIEDLKASVAAQPTLVVPA